MEQRELIQKIRGRIEQCRRLAKSINDPQAAAVLRQMADEGEADIARLLSEQQPEPRQPSPPQEGPAG